MKILIYIFTIVLIGSSCSQINGKRSESQLDEKIKNSKYSTEYRFIKEIIENPDSLYHQNYSVGCFTNWFINYYDDRNIRRIKETFNYCIDDLILVNEDQHGQDLEIIIIEGNKGKGFSFWNVLFNGRWCLDMITIYPLMM